MKEIKIKFKLPEGMDLEFCRLYCMFVNYEGKMVKFGNYSILDFNTDDPKILTDQDFGLYDIYG